MNNAIFLLCTSYAMYIGALFVKNHVQKSDGKEYTAGDTQAIFFGIFFGIFAIGIGAPNFKAMTEGKLNGFSALRVIERVPNIPPNDQNAIFHQVQGKVQVRDLVFTYPKGNKRVLNKVNLVFDKGATTAIVGPSGSGKSTVVQLIERFYDPESGSVLIDDIDL